MVEELGTDQYLNRSYYFRPTPSAPRVELSLHIAYYTGFIDAVPHVPTRCMVAAGFDAASKPVIVDKLPLDLARWTQVSNLKTQDSFPPFTFPHYITAEPVTVHLPLGKHGLNVGLNYTRFAPKMPPQAEVIAGYFFIANGRSTPHPDSIKTLAFDPTQTPRLLLQSPVHDDA